MQPKECNLQNANISKATYQLNSSLWLNHDLGLSKVSNKQNVDLTTNSFFIIVDRNCQWMRYCNRHVLQCAQSITCNKPPYLQLPCFVRRRKSRLDASLQIHWHDIIVISFLARLLLTLFLIRKMWWMRLLMWMPGGGRLPIGIDGWTALQRRGKVMLYRARRHQCNNLEHQSRGFLCPV